jgi:hypothetical protein
MISKVFIALVFISSTITLFGQGNGRGRKGAEPVLHEVSGKEVVQSIYPDAVKVEKVNDYWFKILDKAGKTIGFAMSSTSYCKDIIGYANQTPVIIITDKSFIVKKVALLSNCETFAYVHRLENNGFFNLWNGKTLKAAKSVQIDGYTGATYTATAVSKNVDFLLTHGIEKMPKLKK